MLNSSLFSSYFKRIPKVFQFYCKNVVKNKANTKRKVGKNNKQSFGQPTNETHPHLINSGEITPGITKYEFEQRRQNFMDTLLSRAINKDKSIKQHLIVIPSASKCYMSGKIPYVFRQNSDFLYLTGCQEPDTCLVLYTTESLSNFKSTLFLRPKDSHSELWDGPTTSSDDAQGFFGVNHGLPMPELENYLKSFLKSHPQSKLWYDFLSPAQRQVHNIMQGVLSESICNIWETPIPLVHQLRLIKSQAEIQLMQKSCDVASEAIAKVINISKPGISEHQIFATVDYECRMRGAEFLAYPPVVAGGNRANIIHYINNNQLVQDKEMVLMDAGCEYHGYSSDITRTWPINGKFSNEQRIIYEIVESVQSEIIKLCSTFCSLDRLFDAMCVILGQYLQEIGLISKSASKTQVMKEAYKFCPHHVSHYLGMDLHDTPSISRGINMVPGMVITIEPGVYINDKDGDVFEEFKGIGVRIEDDVLITQNGPVVLSKCPKSRKDVEQLASGKIQFDNN